ncbi:DUF2065 domain-containing protein [Aliikangiella sp. G2MR2-5]|uniref:DUF2065 domain-containing protein n=1 Tax=Aliikangiella sp. G2MR2-5 TaxID=2788943 RepID=UPI0018AB8A7A|nr:DUF2065 domain-containing protein [Aliikangiella sp. G2MR2-5]
MTDFLAAFAIAMILEGMMPFISPKNWREMVIKISMLPDSQLRRFGALVMLSGLVLLYLVR